MEPLHFPQPLLERGARGRRRPGATAEPVGSSGLGADVREEDVAELFGVEDAWEDHGAVASGGLQLHVAIGQPAAPERRADIHVLNFFERNLAHAPRDEPALADDAKGRDGELVEGVDEGAPAHAEAAGNEQDSGDDEKRGPERGLRAFRPGRDEEGARCRQGCTEDGHRRARDEPHPVIPRLEQDLLPRCQVLLDVRHREPSYERWRARQASAGPGPSTGSSECSCRPSCADR